MFLSRCSLSFSEFHAIASSVLLKKPDRFFLHSFCHSPLAHLRLALQWRFLEMIIISLTLLNVRIQRWNLVSLSLFCIPFSLLVFQGYPFEKVDICNYFKGLMSIFLWVWGGGGGGRIFNLLHDLLYELINSINIHLLCFIYLFIYYYYCKLSHIRVCGFLVFVSVCSFGVACVCGFMLFHCFARLDHLVNIQSKHLLVKLTS